jgi:hypothetical protein
MISRPEHRYARGMASAEIIRQHHRLVAGDFAGGDDAPGVRTATMTIC